MRFQDGPLLPLGRRDCIGKLYVCSWSPNGSEASETDSHAAFKFFVQFCLYTFLYCAIVLAAAAYHTHQRVHREESPDGTVLAIIAISGFFGTFTCLMWLTSLRFIFINQTNVDVLSSKTKVYQLAVRVPLGTPSTAMYGTVMYPLPQDGQTMNGAARKPGGTDSASSNEAPSARELRDLRATRQFAILRTEVGENPWDLGWYGNWQSVMGTNVVDYFLPLRRSPCTDHSSTHSMYRMGKVLSQVKARYGLDRLLEREEGSELRNMGSVV